MFTCNQNLEWSVFLPRSKQGGGYIIRWGRLSKVDESEGGARGSDYEIQGQEYGYTCECLGFKYRGDCKHLKAIRLLDSAEPEVGRCKWSGEDVQRAWPGEPDAPVCPRCGGGVEETTA